MQTSIAPYEHNMAQTLEGNMNASEKASSFPSTGTDTTETVSGALDLQERPAKVASGKERGRGFERGDGPAR